MLERWELVPSSQPDRYLLKLRGDRADADRIAQSHSGICQDVRELSDPVYQWVIIVTGATLTDRLTLQDDVRALVSRPPAEPASSGPVDLSGVLAELSLVLEEFKDLTEEEQARVALKMEQIQKKEAAEAMSVVQAPPVPPPVQAVPPPPPPVETPVKPPESSPAPTEKPAEVSAPPMQIVRDVAKPPITKPVKTVSPEQPVKKGEEPKPVVPPPLAVKPVEEPKPAVPPSPPPAVKPVEEPKPAAPPSPPPAVKPVEESKPVVTPTAPVKPVEPPKAAARAVPAPAPVTASELPPAGADEMRIACFYPAGTEEPVKKFLNRLVEVCKTKAKKPFTLNVVVSKPAKIGTVLPDEVIQEMRSSGVVSLIAVLPPDILPEYMDHCVAQIKQQSIHCHLVEQSDLGTQVIFIDLMVELMMERRKR